MKAPKGKARGYYVERKLVELLSRDPHNHVFRVPVSGGRAGKYAFPDVFLVNNVKGLIVAFEVKGTSRRKVVVRRDQLSKLGMFLAPFAKYRRQAVVAVWFFKQGKWVFRRVDGLLDRDLVVTVDEESDWHP